jgi:hypothetical protein
LALLAVENLGVNFDAFARDRVGIALSVRGGSLAVDADYWAGRDNPGGPSPMLFAYTLPSAPIGEIAIRHRLTGPNLCLVGGDNLLLDEVRDWFNRGEIDACLVVMADAITPAAASFIQGPPAAEARAILVQRGGNVGLPLGENDRDMKLLCVKNFPKQPVRTEAPVTN